MTDRQAVDDLLEETVNVLFEWGWAQGRFGDDERGRCLSGALMSARRRIYGFVYGFDALDGAQGAIVREIAADPDTLKAWEGWCIETGMKPNNHPTPIWWNDNIAQSRDDVIDLIKAAQAKVG